MIKKVAIFPDYGSAYIPSEIEDIVKEKGGNWRIAFAEVIDSFQDTHSEIEDEELNRFANSEYTEDRWYIKCKNKFYYKDRFDKMNILYEIRIIEVDTSKKWIINDYNGSECVEYLVLEDEELGLYKTVGIIIEE